MTTRIDQERESGGSEGTGTATRRVLVAAPRTARWEGIVRAIESDHITCTWIDPAAAPAAVAAGLERDLGVLVVDLGPDQVKGLNLVAACRQRARLAPVVVVAASPSIDLARRIRQSGVFFLALDPVTPDEMHGVVVNAFDCLARHRPDASSCRTRPRILVVDDDADFVTSVTALLDSQGYAVATARSAREALDHVRTEGVDLIVLDIMMEYDAAGYEVNQALKFGPAFECFRQVPILMVSSIDIDPATRFRMAGEVDLVTPDGYLAKPLDIPKFLDTIKALLGPSSPASEA